MDLDSLLRSRLIRNDNGNRVDSKKNGGLLTTRRNREETAKILVVGCGGDDVVQQHWQVLSMPQPGVRTRYSAGAGLTRQQHWTTFDRGCIRINKY
jgi:biotin-(acetyl-CoA carboxylase) ligase